jgi:phage tail sheath protein FI
VRTITGVATSITAFIGRAAAGPTDDPVLLTSYADYERRFGGLDLACPMSYAVRDFYRNGGSLALVVRVVAAATPPAAAAIVLGTAPDALTLAASSPGTWGNSLSAVVDYDTDLALAGASDADKKKLFNLSVSHTPRGGEAPAVSESFPAVSTDATHARYVAAVLRRDSTLVVVQGDVPGARPPSNVVISGPNNDIRTATPVKATGGGDGGEIDDGDISGSRAAKTGLFALNKADLFNLLCIPPRTRDATTPESSYKLPGAAVYADAIELCVSRRAMLIVDPSETWASAPEKVLSATSAGRAALALTGPAARNAALYFPMVRAADPLRGGRLDLFPPCGAVAGVMARTDTTRGVWKAPAGLDAALNGVQDLQLRLNDLENGQLNQLGINCLRSFPVSGRVVWGARTLRGADLEADEYKYVPVRRLALFLEESLYRGTQWVVFEPNDEPLWAQIRLNIGAFMQGLFLQGAFQGTTPRDAYFVRCGHDTTTQNHINLGIVNIVVGFAPLKPAEFVVISFQQMAGQIDT